MPFHLLDIRRDGPVERVALNRPEVRNAFDERLVAELRAWADAAARDADLRVAILQGHGRVFSAGADLGWMARMAAASHEENVGDARAMAEMFAALDRLPTPLVGRVHGAALGGGCGLAAVCDVVVAEEDAAFGFTEVRLGLMPAVIAPYVLAKIGMSAARELFLTGGRVGAARAREIGLVHHVAEAGTLDARVDVVVADLLAGGPEAIAATKALLAGLAARPAGEAAASTAGAIADRRRSPEGQAGVRAFLERAVPPWSRT